MKSVSFEHRIHGNVTTTCRSCRHETLDACDTCYTRGKHEGGRCYGSVKDMSMKRNNCSTCHNGSQERRTVAESMDRGFDLSAVVPDDYMTSGTFNISVVVRYQASKPTAVI